MEQGSVQNFPVQKIRTSATGIFETVCSGKRGVDPYKSMKFFGYVTGQIFQIHLIHDAFELKAWKDFMREDKYKNVVLDTHQYLMMAEAMGCPQTVEGYKEFIKEHYEKPIREMEEYFPVICGEWCLFNSLACGHDTKGGQSVLNGMEEEDDRVLSDEERGEIYRELARTQLEAWEKGSGYFYWNYKLLTDTVNDSGWAGWDSWDLGRCVDFGWFPVKK